jgi:hypothetical protein
MKLLDKLPSYKYLLAGAMTAMRRFPFTLASALIGTVAVVALIEMENADKHFALQKLIFICALGIPLFTAAAALAHKRGKGIVASIGYQIIALGLLAIYYVSLPHSFIEYTTQPVRFVILFVSCHLLVAFLPYLGPNQARGFWQYNKSLFLRFLTSALYSAVMFIGLAIALAAADQLFGLDVPEKRYFQLFAIMAGAFNTWVFLAGIPGHLELLNETDDYPKGMKIFAQYILLPLVGLYLVILYAYELKIIVEWNWPKGWVSQLVLWFSVVGMLSLLLLWPLRERDENRWIKTFTKWFFRALIPLVVMLFLAILERVGVYGITVNRYLVLAMAVSLAILVLYFVFGRQKDIRSIPVVICIVALASAYGPWSAFEVSKHSQQGRLGKYLTKNDITPGVDVKEASERIPLDDRNEMSGAVSYLLDWHGPNAFSPWLSDSTIESYRDTTSGRISYFKIAEGLGFEYISHWRQRGEKNQFFRFTAIDSSAAPLSGFDYLVFVNHYDWSKEPPQRAFAMGDDTCFVWIDGQPPIFRIRLNADSTSAAELPLADKIDSLWGKWAEETIPREYLTYDAIGNGFSARIIFGDLTGMSAGDSITLSHVSAYVLIRKEP